MSGNAKQRRKARRAYARAMNRRMRRLLWGSGALPMQMPARERLAMADAIRWVWGETGADA
jgi:hypothetical protein